MNRIPGYNLMIVCCLIVLAGGLTAPVTAVLCDGPPNSQSFILFSGGCDRSSQALPCTQGFIFPAQPSPDGDFPTRYYLDFGDGSPPYYGAVDGISHTYTNPGHYSLNYGAGTQCDLWRYASYELDISAPANYTPVITACPPSHPSAAFIAAPTSGFAPMSVQFSSTSIDADAYFWRFGDGATSPARDPEHTYRAPGTYSVSLEARDSCTGTVNRINKHDLLSLTTTAGTLSISSNPDGAMVFIDNIVKGMTPVILTDTSPGSHRLLLRKEGYDDYARTIIIEPATPATFGVTLTRSPDEPTARPTSSPGSIAVTSSPSGATVYLNGRMAGITPVIVADIATGIHEIILSLPGYDNQSHIVSVGSGQIAAINGDLVVTKETTGALAVISDPPGAEIYIDGMFKGVSPVTITGISSGTHTVSLALHEYANNTSSISIIAGETQKHSPVLQKVFKPSELDIVLAIGAIVLLGIIAVIVMFRKDPKKR